MSMEHDPFIPYMAANKSPDGYTYVHGFGFTPPPQVPTQSQMIRSYSSGIGLAVLAYFVLSYFVPSVMSFIRSLAAPTLDLIGAYRLSEEVGYHLSQVISFCVSVLLPFGIYANAIRMPLRAALPIRSASAVLVIGAVPAVLACSAIGSFAGSLIEAVFAPAGIIPSMPPFMMPVETPARIIYMLRLCLIAPVVEEFVFRGFIMQSLRRFGDSFALVCSAVLFAAVHANLIQMPNAFITGLAFGYFSLHTGSLIPAIAAHVINNTLAVAATVLTAPMPAPEQELIAVMLSMLYLLAGAAAFVIMLRTRPNMFTLIYHADDTFEQPSKYRSMFLSLPMIAAFVIIAAITIQYTVAV